MAVVGDLSVFDLLFSPLLSKYETSKSKGRGVLFTIAVAAHTLILGLIVCCVSLTRFRAIYTWKLDKIACLGNS